MADEKHIKRLINANTRRLAVLEEKQALQGVYTPAYIILEIEDIKAEITTLKKQLDPSEVNLNESVSRSQNTPPPVEEINNYNTENIYSLLTEGFSAAELQRFCYQTPTFKPVSTELSNNAPVATIADIIINFSERKMILHKLLQWAQKNNPDKYKLYQPYY